MFPVKELDFGSSKEEGRRQKAEVFFPLLPCFISLDYSKLHTKLLQSFGYGDVFH
ncbi:hypothetical protein [Trichodesmium erythraeum]|uniref:hypothetical protein n=1 Tax=Trichodesmium erythraeum TaxID=1206 RepID=UPI00003C9D14